MTTQEPTTYKRRTVHYKRAVIGGSKQYLQSILEEALGEGGAYELASSRKEQIDPNDPSAGFHLINKSQHYESIFFGQFRFPGDDDFFHNGLHFSQSGLFSFQKNGN